MQHLGFWISRSKLSPINMHNSTFLGNPSTGDAETPRNPPHCSPHRSALAHNGTSYPQLTEMMELKWKHTSDPTRSAVWCWWAVSNRHGWFVIKTDQRFLNSAHANQDQLIRVCFFIWKKVKQLSVCFFLSWAILGSSSVLNSCSQVELILAEKWLWDHTPEVTYVQLFPTFCFPLMEEKIWTVILSSGGLKSK